MAVLVSMLRGVNVGSHNRLKMEALREVYESLGLLDARTYVQSGNIVFKSEVRDVVQLARRIESGIERRFGFRPDVIVRTTAELKEVVSRNPFAARRGIEPNRLLVVFLAADPGHEARDRILRIKTDPEELRMEGRELYIYFPNGMGRPKLPVSSIEKMLKMSGTGRNWNTVTKLLDIAERLETPP